MSGIDAIRNKTQRFLTKNLGRVEIDDDGDFIVKYNSAIAFVQVQEGFKDGYLIRISCPLIMDVRITNELCRWIAVEGQWFRLGACGLRPNDDGKTGMVIFNYGLTADDLDESELMNALFATISTCDKLDNQLQDMFGGKLFGKE